MRQDAATSSHDGNNIRAVKRKTTLNRTPNMQTNEELEELIYQHITRDNYRPVKPKVIAKKLKLDKERFPEVRKAIKRLIKQGKVVWGAKHLVQAVATDMSPKRAKPAAALEDRGIIGTYRPTSQGYGFVSPQRQPGERADAIPDVFIPPRKEMGAISGDLVRVKIGSMKGRRGQGPDGTIVEVVERQTHRFVGVYREEPGYYAVEVDGHVFSNPIPVGDPGAKRVVDGDKVVIEIVHFPKPHDEGEGVIVEVLGARGKPGVDTISIIREFNLPERFSDEVLEVAREQAEEFDESIGDGRVDLTATTVITIDPKDARDFDDAISMERLENGHWRLGVHIADVSHFVPVGSALDVEARERATSVYLPDRVIPMLPEVISNNLASLQPDRVRYAKSVFIEFTAEGTHVHTELQNSAIRSDRRFTYEEVDDFLAHPSLWRSNLTKEVFTLLDNMHKLAMILRRLRLENGAIELGLPEVKIDLDKNGKVTGAHVTENTESHQIIEEFMLKANEAVAQFLTDKGLHFLRRVHEPPNPRKLEALTKFVREVGIECDSLQSRFEIKRVLELVLGKPEAYAIHYAVLRSMSKAHYSPQEEKHYALNSQHYCHFTSPIRRYPDFVVHRMITDLLAGKRPVDDFEKLMVLGEHCSDRERRAESAERELTKLKLLNFLSSKLGLEMDAVITGVRDAGFYAQGVQLPAEGFVHVASLQDDYYHYERGSHSLTGRKAGNAYRLGDLVRVEVVHVEPDHRELEFRVVRRVKAAERPKSSSRKRDKTRGRANKPGKDAGTKTKRKKKSRKRK